MMNPALTSKLDAIIRRLIEDMATPAEILEHVKGQLDPKPTPAETPAATPPNIEDAIEASVGNPDLFNRSLDSDSIIVLPLRNDDAKSPTITELDGLEVEGKPRPTAWEPIYPAGVRARVIDHNGIDAVELDAKEIEEETVAAFSYRMRDAKTRESTPCGVRVNLLTTEPERIPPTIGNQAWRAIIGHPIEIKIVDAKHVMYDDSQGHSASISRINGERVKPGSKVKLSTGVLEIYATHMKFTADSSGYEAVKVQVTNTAGAVSTLTQYGGTVHITS